MWASFFLAGVFLVFTITYGISINSYTHPFSGSRFADFCLHFLTRKEQFLSLLYDWKTLEINYDAQYRYVGYYFGLLLVLLCLLFGCLAFKKYNRPHKQSPAA